MVGKEEIEEKEEKEEYPYYDMIFDNVLDYEYHIWKLLFERVDSVLNNYELTTDERKYGRK